MEKVEMKREDMIKELNEMNIVVNELLDAVEHLKIRINLLYVLVFIIIVGFMGYLALLNNYFNI